MAGRDIRTPQHLQILYCSIYGFLSLIAIFILIISCKNLYCKKCNKNNKQSTANPHRNTEMNIYLKNSTIMALFGYILALIVCFFATLIEVVYNPSRSDRSYEKPLGLIGISFYMLGRWTMLLLFIQRIDYTFRDSIFAYSKCYIHSLYITIMLLFVSLCFYVILGFSEFIEDNDTKQAIMIYGILSWVIIEFIFSTILLIMFIKKLFTLFLKTMKYKISENIAYDIEMSSRSKSKSPSKSKSGGCSTPNRPNTPKSPSTSKTDTNTMALPRLTLESIATNSLSRSSSVRKATEENVDPTTLNAMTKYTLLVFIALCSSVMSILISLKLSWAYWVFMIVGADAFINTICIYLFNKFAKRLYKILCKYPNKCCECLCIQCISCVFMCKNCK